MLKFYKPHASTKCIVLWISSASTKCTYSVAVKLFCWFSSRSDDHVHPAEAGNVDVWWKFLKTYASGVL
jgi:hypothetical protein